ncbi:MAG: hypothetical protein WBW93_02860 [Steroidobacteraceae bacterium]
MLIRVAWLVLLALWLTHAQAGEVLSRVGTLVVPSASASHPFVDWDIELVDDSIDRFVLADVSDRSLDVYQASTGTFLFSVRGFSGARKAADWALNGPSGVVVVATVYGMEAWVGDGNSTVKVVSLATGRVVDTISTGGETRVDELTYDPRDQLVLADNPSERIPVATLISTAPGHAILGRLSFPNATAGLEQGVWSPETGLIYLDVPELRHGEGGLAIIDPVAKRVVKMLRIPRCHPNGIALSLSGHLLLGCRQQKSKSGRELSSALMLDLRTEKQLVSFPGIVSDEIAFNPRDERFYLSAYDQPTGPELIALDSAVPARPSLAARTGDLAHSVAVDARTNHIFVPLRPDSGDPACLYGCIGVYMVTRRQ